MQRFRTPAAAGAVVALVLIAAGCSSGSKAAAPVTGSTRVPTSVPGVQTRLRLVGVQSVDVPKGYTVDMYQVGDKVDGQVTLDVCSARYPSEQLRTDRLQEGVNDAKHQEALSTEAVLYQNGAATAQAFSELRAARAQCPATFVPGAIKGESPLKTVFGAVPDVKWPPTPGIDRLAFDATVSDQRGDHERSVVVYLRRGRLLLAVYFRSASGPQVSIDGRTSIAAITDLFESRLAAVPASSIG